MCIRIQHPSLSPPSSQIQRWPVHRKDRGRHGKGTGIGKRIAKALYDEGAFVHILGRRQKKLLEARKEAFSASTLSDDGRFFCHECDVSDDRRVLEVFDSIRGSTGPARGLVNCATINLSRNGITETALEDRRATLEVNLTGAFNCCKAAIEQMLAGGGYLLKG